MVRAEGFGEERPRPLEGGVDPNNYASKVDGITVSQVISVLGVKEIKEALRVRGLSPTGRKKDLLDRLVESIYGEIGFSVQVETQYSYPDVGPRSRQNESGVPTMEQLMEMTGQELKEMCRTAGQPTVGSKAELARRVYGLLRGDNAAEADVAGAAAATGFQWGGNVFVDPRKMTLKDLRESLKALNLAITGTKPELVARLEAALYDPAGAQESANQRMTVETARRKDNSVRGELVGTCRKRIEKSASRETNIVLPKHPCFYYSTHDAVLSIHDTTRPLLFLRPIRIGSLPRWTGWPSSGPCA